MAYTCRDVITLAMKKLGVLRSGGEPKAADAADALASLQSFYFECITQGTFGRVTSIIATADLTAYPGQHINNTDSGTITVTLPTTSEWWWTDPVPPADLSVIRSTDLSDTRLTHFYDGQTQRWVSIETLALEDEAPLSSRGYDGLASVLAVRLVDLFGDSLLSARTMKSANSFMLALVSRHGIGDEVPYYENDYGWLRAGYI